MKKLIVESSVNNLEKIMSFVNSSLEEHNCDPDLQSQIGIAVEEIFINIVKYAYTPDNGDVVVSIFTGKEIVIRFEDTGKPYNPLERTDPDLQKPIMDRKIGGLGIYLTKKLMDKVSYSRIDNVNVLTMTKEIKQGRQSRPH